MGYAMLLFGDEAEWNEAEAAGAMDEVFAWFARWEAEGKIGKGGIELDSVRKAKTIRPGPDGPVVTDGPYLELKEVVGGFILLTTDDIDEAVAVAATWPMQGSSSVELRPLIDR